MECHLNDRHPRKRQGLRWVLSPETVVQILDNGGGTVNSGLKNSTGLLSIGSHTKGLYSKKLFP